MRPTVIIQFEHDIKVMPNDEAKKYSGSGVYFPLGWYVFKGDEQVGYQRRLSPAIAKAEQLEHLENLKHSA